MGSMLVLGIFLVGRGPHRTCTAVNIVVGLGVGVGLVSDQPGDVVMVEVD
jgi:hypothetical protein